MPKNTGPFQRVPVMDIIWSRLPYTLWLGSCALAVAFLIGLPVGVLWVDAPPSSRDVAVSAELLAHVSLTPDAKAAVLTLGFDPVLWGALRPAMRALGLL